MKIWLVHLKSSDETYHTVPCASQLAAERVLQGAGIITMTHRSNASAMSNEFQQWKSPTNASHTATVVIRDVVQE